MAYIGRDPAYGNLVKQTLTPNSVTTDFTLDYAVATAASIIVSVGGVVQQPDTAYTIINSYTISFSEAPASGLEVFIIYLGRTSELNTVVDDAITTAKLQANAVSTVKIANFSVTSAKLDNNISISGVMTAADFNSTSDILLKDNIAPIGNPLETISKLNGIQFTWKNTGEKSYGLSAQDVEKILPDIVRTREDGNKGINYLNIIAFLIEAVKDLSNEVNQLKNK